MDTRRVACIGECMVELREGPDGLFRRSHGGDTLNTAVYLARLGVRVDYVTALGDDAWSGEMLEAWRAEGVGVGLVRRLPGRVPGLYVIQTDAAGERRFLYWRDSAAARELFRHLDPAALDAFDVLYVSGITLSIYDPAGRAALHGALAAARARGAWVVFDTNYRPRNWPDAAAARREYAELYGMATMVLASAEDLRLLDPAEGEETLMRHVDTTEVVLKLDLPQSRVHAGGAVHRVEAGPVAAGHALAGLVVGHPGAIVPRAVMPHDLPACPA